MMPISFRIKLVDPTQYEAVAEQFSGRASVERVVDQRATLEPLFLVMNRASWVTGSLAAIMALAAVLLITTTIRLSAMNRLGRAGASGDGRRRVGRGPDGGASAVAQDGQDAQELDVEPHDGHDQAEGARPGVAGG